MRTFLIFIFLITSLLCRAQNLLPVEEAIQIALKKNYDILISRNEADINKVNNTAGNAGMLPDIGLTGSGNYNLKNSHQELQGGNVSDNPSLGTNTFNTGAELSWTLFDGGKMFVTKNKLNQIEALGELQFKEQVLQTIYDVIAGYYNIVKQKQQLNSINQTISYNRERVKIMQTAYNSGSAGKTDFLQAKIDLNVYLENAISQQSIIDDAKRELNRLLGEENGWSFEVSDSIPLNYSPDKKELEKKLYSSNPTILSFQKQTEINRLMLKEVESTRLPKINFNAGYFYNHTGNTDGSVLLNRSFGPQIGATFSLPIYQSGDINRLANIAKIELSSATFRLEDYKLQLNTQLQNALNQFENQQKLLQIETDNAALTKENLEISLQRLKLGQTNSLEVHLAQEEFVQSFTRLINFKYNLKMAEIRLKQLMGDL
jgi:outer membrane protein TolC